jgi:hypothetical protein
MTECTNLGETGSTRSNRAPIALFVYRRTDLLGSVLDSLEACPEFQESDVFVFSDGPKNAAAAPDVAQVRALVRARLRPNMTLIEAPENRGLANSIIAGVTRLCEEYGRVIVIEDDLVVSPALLSWFNSALHAFADDPAVMQISGHAFDVASLRTREEGLFLPLITSWGWATWRRAWSRFDPGARGWEAIKSDPDLRRRFDLDGCYPYGKMLERQMNGEVDSWAVRWYWTSFTAGGLTLFPPRSLVLNEGADFSATHAGFVSRLRHRIIRRKTALDHLTPTLPKAVVVEPDSLVSVQKCIWRTTSKLSLHYWLTR